MSESIKQPSLFSLSVSGKCPACQKSSIFKGAIAFKETCDACGLDITKHDNGDGPATGVMLVAGAIMLIVAFALEIAYHTPLWVHIVVGGMAMLASAWWSLRFFKAMLLTLQYRYRKKEMENG